MDPGSLTIWRILAKCHDCRNLAEYEDHVEIDNQLLLDLLKATKIVLDAVDKLQK